MTPYTLAKEMAEAGYPQRHINPCTECSKPDCLINIEEAKKGPYKPGLEEVIEALGNPVKGTGFLMVRYTGYSDVWEAEARVASEFVMHYKAKGPTPLIAVCNLWLQINRKDK